MPISNPSPTFSNTETVSTQAPQISNSLSTTASVLVASNSNRKGLTFFNSSDKTIYVDFSNSVTTSDYAFKLAPDAYYEMPQPIYTGAFHAILSTGTASIEVREFS
ncbi:hypothetical protein [Calothrix sp. 336/3]|uniref:hypothetical protein n=1 Tax=Calothrix sp. 336/3 TaxID=1337936 RepID=UPI0004E35A40|nr:hypothetical protein [Calothrix sp. 336/3]AKG21269.1 hypothetical protein IJ00_08120 [Calothrix sp. 336/3]